ncbi:MAG: hypothetical protein ABW072_19115 [Sedimenticola sp.]
MLNRREFIGTAALVSTLGFSSNGSIASDENVPIDQLDFSYAPQFYIGNPDAKNIVEILWSGTCVETKVAFEEYLLDLCYQTAKNNDALIFFHHFSRDEKELEVGAEILSVGRQNYPNFCYRLIRWSSINKKKLSVRRIKKKRKQAGFDVEPNFDYQKAKQSMLMLRKHCDARDIYSLAIYVNGKKIENSKEALYEELSKNA